MFLIGNLASLGRQAGTYATESLIVPLTLMHACLSNSRPATDRQTTWERENLGGAKFARLHARLRAALCNARSRYSITPPSHSPNAPSQTALAIARGWQAHSGLVGRNGTYIDTEPRRAGKVGEKGCPNVKKASWDPRIPACPSAGDVAGNPDWGTWTDLPN